MSCLTLINGEFEIHKDLRLGQWGSQVVVPGAMGTQMPVRQPSRLWGCLGGPRQPKSPEGRGGLN